ncbi:MAG: hypothetical protein R3F43_25340 [bacterium]
MKAPATPPSKPPAASSSATPSFETQDPEFLRKFSSMEAWRRFFLGDPLTGTMARTPSTMIALGTCPTAPSPTPTAAPSAATTSPTRPCSSWSSANPAR